jgi:hypothetical protein
MITILLHLFCDFLRFFLISIIHCITIFQSYMRSLHSMDSLATQLQKLQAKRSTLLAQCDSLQQQIAHLDASITCINRLSTSISLTSPESQEQVTNFSAMSTQRISSIPPNSTNFPPQHTPQRRNYRPNTCRSFIGEPYPLPFTPPRTPEEKCRNNIIIWVNELRSQNNTSAH